MDKDYNIIKVPKERRCKTCRYEKTKYGPCNRCITVTYHYWEPKDGKPDEPIVLCK